MAKFKIGDKVRRGGQIGVVKGVEKEPYIEVKFTNEPVTVFVHEEELVAANVARNAKFKVGDRVKINPSSLLMKLYGNARLDWVGEIVGFDGPNNPIVEWGTGDLKKGPISDIHLVLANAARSRNAVVQKALNATASNSNWKTEDFDVAAKKIKSKYKVITWVSHSPSGEERIDVAVRPNEDVNKVAQDVIRIFKGEGIDMKVAGSTPLHYLGGLPPKQKSATWFRLLPMNSSVHTTNAVVAKALNASRVARNGYVVLRTASGGTARVYEGEEVEYDGKSYKAAALGSPSMAEATLVDGAGNKIVVRMRDPRLKAKASNAVEARCATPVGG